ncbi:GNAT family N-acetyltransferase [Streptomyces sp. HSW2009]|uniref:GNAT family N-acetyltransferase n=1 Tax=Streptomyces sp. HSW2009 TaxID=3142890 RepID=UPI0032EC77DF
MLTYDRYEGGEAVAVLDAFIATYEEVYAEPPYREELSDVAIFIEHYQVHCQRPGMRLVLARDDEEVVGFAYGYLLTPDTRWWKNLLEVELPAPFARETGNRTWVIIELAVRKAWRRRGIAAGLHTRLLEGLCAERVTLTVRPEPEAAPARSAYAAWGYRRVGTSQPWEGAPYYETMLLELDTLRT